MNSHFDLVNNCLFNTGPFPKSPTINSSEVLASTFSNVSLTCLFDKDDNCPDESFWYLNDKQLESGEKYDIVEKKTRTKCKEEYILSIFNVTKNDEGNYSCHWLCEYETTTTAAIDLKVTEAQPPTGKNFLKVLSSISYTQLMLS